MDSAIMLWARLMPLMAILFAFGFCLGYLLRLMFGIYCASFLCSIVWLWTAYSLLSFLDSIVEGGRGTTERHAAVFHPRMRSSSAPRCRKIGQTTVRRREFGDRLACAR
eukprot:gb/GEZN01015615.1/.p1 GENE.gb/GEZN01015615.1/~~gb/GEZN01015615.1/.p1  ORF type:complete len:109 (+),score=1.50 gb/GEZN01015615.1/:126-452(+)